MPVDQVSSTDYSTTYTRNTSKDDSNSKVNTETFLKLLVAQLKYQDPLEPQKDTAFVSQMAQMSSLQELQSVNASVQNSQAYDMIGKYIYAEVHNNKTGALDKYAGKVDWVVIQGGIPYLVVGNTMINIADVKELYNELPGGDNTSGNTPSGDTPSGDTPSGDTPPA